jgi:chromosome segregation ATPase
MSTLTDKLPKLPTDKLPKLPAVKLPELDLVEAKKPAFAAVGVVDATVEQVKDLPADAKKVQEKLQARFEARTTQFNAQLKTVPAQLKTVPAQLKALPTQVKGLRTELEGRVSKAQSDATKLYAELAVRGEKLVGQIRRQPATESALAEGKAAVKKAQSATTSAKKATKATGTAVEDAAAKIG